MNINETLLLRAYANLYYIFKDLLGIDLPLLKIFQSFGFFLAIAFFGAAFFLVKELKRKESLGLISGRQGKVVIGEAPKPTEIAINAAIGFVLGIKIFPMFTNFGPIGEDPQGYFLSTEGNLITGILGALALGGWYYWKAKKQQLPKPKVETITIHPHDMIGDIVIVAAISGIIGAKLFYLFESPGNFSNFIKDPAGSFFGGLTIYGGWICGALATGYFVKKRGMNPIHAMDAAAPTLFVAYGIGRLGCQVSGDGDWGIDNLAAAPGWLPEWLWSNTYAYNVANEGVLIEGCTEAYCRVLANPVYPTPLYETMMAFLLFGFLWSIRKKITVPGVMFSVYLILNGVERFFIEKIRVNTTFELAGMQVTQAEIIAVAFVLLGIAGIFGFTRYYKGKTP